MARTLRVSDNGAGHNSGGMIDGEALKRYVDRVVRLMEERKALNTDIKEVYDESKDAGFVTKHLRQLVREAMMEPEVLEDHLAQMDALRHALGQFANTPLGSAAVDKAAKPKRDRRNKGRIDADFDTTSPREEHQAARHQQGRTHPIQDAFDKAAAHLSGQEVADTVGNEMHDALSAGAVPSPFEDDEFKPAV